LSEEIGSISFYVQLPDTVSPVRGEISIDDSRQTTVHRRIVRRASAVCLSVQQIRPAEPRQGRHIIRPQSTDNGPQKICQKKQAVGSGQ